MISLEGQTLGPYRIVEQIGRGGMATVYKAYHARLDRTVAIKIMHQAHLQDESFLARFEREAQIVARLEHPHIVPIYDFADYNGQPYLVMKFVEGQTLKSLLTARPLTLEEILWIMPPIADALDYAHRQDVLHRDIKPSNILLDTNGTPYLTDFGLARLAALGESTLSSELLLGTPYYISPEQAAGRRDLTTRTDLYSLGVVLYELVVGRVPFSADTAYAVIHDHIYREAPPPHTVNPDISPKVSAVLTKALAKEPTERYDSAAALMAAFRAAVEASGMPSLSPSRREDAAEVIDQLRHEASAPLPPKAPPAPRAPEPPKPNRKVEFSFDTATLGLGKVDKALDETQGTIKEAVEGLLGIINPDTTLEDDETAIRRRAEQQVKQRSEFFGHLAAFVAVNAGLWAMFLFGGGNLGGSGFPWPFAVTLGWGSGLIAHAIELHYETGRRAAVRLRAVREAYYHEFGENWRSAKKSALKKVRSRAEKPFNQRKEFFQHAGVYVTINLMLWIIYLTSNNALINLINDGDITQILSFPWPLMVSFFWGLGLVAHANDLVSNRRKERAIERTIEQERAMLYGEKPKRALMDDYEGDSTAAERRVRLTEDGEFTDSLIVEIESEQKRKRR